MKRIYSHPDAGVVHLVRNELEQRGIRAVVRGEHLAAAGVPMEAWGELWLLDEGQLPEAARVVRAVTKEPDDADAPPWTCPACGERVEPQFAVCWHCGWDDAA